ncbi:MAG: DUF4262 domain-containing protein [Proteobacteria bacterium]|nr:DUF4262 domain-containing protein [Pseudomonadota bacterium]MBU1610711.1 DUF4262 domain-containing protein [Pseudomonadota bacterium]
MARKDKTDCECALCSGKMDMQELDEQSAQLIHRYGWYAHYVLPKVAGEMGDYHTHGVVESFAHLNFQVTLPIEPKEVHSTFHRVINLVKEGVTFTDGLISDEIIRDMPVKFVETTDVFGERVLRIILPDHNGLVEGADMEPFYQKQYPDL